LKYLDVFPADRLTQQIATAANNQANLDMREL
jgi:hypothetical protein